MIEIAEPGKDPVEIVDYDPRWPSLFDAEAKRLRAALDPSLIVGLEHFGSTAVPTLSAKPVIDILLVVAQLKTRQELFVVLADKCRKGILRNILGENR